MKRVAVLSFCLSIAIAGLFWFVKAKAVAFASPIELADSSGSIAQQPEQPMVFGSSTVSPTMEIPLVDGSQSPYRETSDPPAETEILEPSLLILDQPLQDQDAPVKKDNPEQNFDSGKLVPTAPGTEIYPAEQDKKEDAKSFTFSAPDGWMTLMSEGFEGAFPNGLWSVFDNNGTSYGEYYWDDDDYLPHYGAWSAWPANGGANGIDPQYYYYPNNMNAWMVYGPFDLTNATDAELLFYYWNQSEANYDYLKWYASANGTTWAGWKVSGNSNGWHYVNFDLTSVPYIGNLVGDSSVWIAFVFTSDGSIVDDGPFIDDVFLQKYSSSLTVTSAWTTGGNAIPKTNFKSGEGIRFYGNVYNGTGQTVTAYYVISRTGPCGSVTLFSGNMSTPPGSINWYLPRYLPNSCPGNYSFTFSATYNGVTTSKSASFTVSGIAGIDYHMNSDFHVFKIDMWSANLSFKTVMANDSQNVNQSPSPREYVSNMVSRSPYSGQNPVLAFNADYFGDTSPIHGPEGLTVKNGVRFDGYGANPDDTDGNEWKRSSLSITSSKGLRVGIQPDCTGYCVNWVPNSSAYYQTVGGGPLFVNNGQRIGGSGSTQPCQNEGFTNTYCTSQFKWTAVGITQDGRYLIVIVTNDATKTMDQAASVLIAEGAWRAIKLDGGGSTQVWYKPLNSIIFGGRPIANAILVFSAP